MPDLINERQVLKLLQADQSALLVNTSGGKDSDAMLKAIWDWAQRRDRQRKPDQAKIGLSRDLVRPLVPGKRHLLQHQLRLPQRAS